jgi:tryptophan 2,3-dioxygenase
MKLIYLTFLIPLLAGCARSPAPAKQAASHKQEPSAPCWRSEFCRLESYSEDEWYLGFAEDTLAGGTNTAEIRNALEQKARSKMVESIRMAVSSRTETETKSELKSGNGFSNETINKIFEGTIKITSNAEVINAFTDSYHDSNGKKAYAFAAVRKSDLAAYYAQMIELNLSEAMHSIALSKQLIELGKRNEAFIKLSEAKQIIDATAQHRVLLLTVDAKTGLERSQSERANELLKEIAMVRADVTAVRTAGDIKDVKAIFVAGTETIQQKRTDIIASGLQTILYENDVRITENREEASYILKIDAEACNLRANNNIHYANACVKVFLSNAKTNINELATSLTGPKEGGLSVENAGEKAFRSAVPEVWAKVKDKILEDL